LPKSAVVRTRCARGAWRLRILRLDGSGRGSPRQAHPDSDLDVFIEIEPNRKFSLIDLAGVQNLLTTELGVTVDLTTRSSLHPKLRVEIEREAVRAF